MTIRNDYPRLWHAPGIAILTKVGVSLPSHLAGTITRRPYSLWKERNGMQCPIGSVTNEQLAAADIIWAVDPQKPPYSVQVFGQESIAHLTAPGAPAYNVSLLEVEIDSSNDVHLQSLLRQVESAKGHLPLVVQPLKH